MQSLFSVTADHSYSPFFCVGVGATERRTLILLMNVTKHSCIGPRQCFICLCCTRLCKLQICS